VRGDRGAFALAWSPCSAPPLRRLVGQILETGPSAVAQCDDELSAPFERESAPVAQRIRAADFGPSRPMRCGMRAGGRAKRVELSAHFAAARVSIR